MFKKLFLILFICLGQLNHSQIQAISAVTYLFSGGRLGDNLIAYSHAKWISYKYDIPLLYKPFNYSDQLVMHTKEEIFSTAKEDAFKQSIVLQKDFIIDRDADILYIVPFFPESFIESGNPEFPSAFTVNWSDSTFISILRDFIKPRLSIKKLSIPGNCLSVAVHVRKGIEFDGPKHQFQAPHKEPQNSYYIEQLQRIITLYPDTSIYVYVFTDYSKPYEIVQLFQKSIKANNIVFAYRETGNMHNQNVIDDLFALTEFDCLIRSDSSFSIIASKIGDYKVQISPYNISYQRDGSLVVDKVKIELNSGESIIKNYFGTQKNLTPFYFWWDKKL